VDDLTTALWQEFGDAILGGRFSRLSGEFQAFNLEDLDLIHAASGA